jgi:cytochrome c-type biogenesis protein CcsB
MELLTIITVLCYLISTVGYVAYLFKQYDRFFKAGFYLLIAGFVCHTLAVGYAYVISGHIPAHNLSGTLLVTGWVVSGVFIVFQYKFRLKVLGIYVAPLLTLVVFIASKLPNTPLLTKNVFNSFWLVFHIITAFVGDAAFALACGVGLFYLAQERAIKMKFRGFLFRRLPSLELIDNTGYACIAVGFTMLTIGLITGMVYAKMIWGKFWSWDPKEIWSGITWLLYATLLHGRVSVGWRGRKAAIMSIIGFAVLLFTFFGVNFFLEGHHGEFTRY